MMGQNLKFFGWNGELNTPYISLYPYSALGIILLFQRRYTNRPIVELEAAAQEELKITELRLAKLFSSEPTVPSTEGPATQSDKAAGINSTLSVCRLYKKCLPFLLYYMFVSFVISILYLYACSQSQMSTPYSVLWTPSNLFNSYSSGILFFHSP
jgi:hypothetical protein